MNSFFALIASVGFLSAIATHASDTFYWGANGEGGDGRWNSSESNWWNGSQTVAWSSGKRAIFGGVGGIVSPSNFLSGPSEMVFESAGYTISGGWLFTGSVLSIITHQDATVTSTLSTGNVLSGTLIKSGDGKLIMGGTSFLEALVINRGELHLADTSNLYFADTISMEAGTTLTFGSTSTHQNIRSLYGSGTIRPDDQARTVTLSVQSSGLFSGELIDNGLGVLALDFISSSIGLPQTLTLTGANTYTGGTSVRRGTLRFSENGTARETQSIELYDTGTLELDNADMALSHRLKGNTQLSLRGGTLRLKGHQTEATREAFDLVSFSKTSTVESQRAGEAATEITFADHNRVGGGVLSVTGDGTVKIASLSNTASGIVAPYVISGREWARVTSDGAVEAFSAYGTSQSVSGHVKLQESASIENRGALNWDSLNVQTEQEIDPIITLYGTQLNLTTGGIQVSGDHAVAIEGGSISSASSELLLINHSDVALSTIVEETVLGSIFTKAGKGILTLTADNQHTGSTRIADGELVVSSDGNLGKGATVEISGGSLRAGASFASDKKVSGSAEASSIINTNGFDVRFSAAEGTISKHGDGSLIISNAGNAGYSSVAGTLILQNASDASLRALGGTNVVSGRLSSFSAGGVSASSILDIGGHAVETLTVGSFSLLSSSVQLRFDLGANEGDLLIVESGRFIFSLTNSPSIYIDINNLGDLAAGAAYDLIQFGHVIWTPSSSAFFSLTPELLALGWDATFHVSNAGVSMHLNAIPEGSTTWMMLTGVLAASVYGWYRRGRRVGVDGNE